MPADLMSILFEGAGRGAIPPATEEKGPGDCKEQLDFKELC